MSAIGDFSSVPLNEEALTKLLNETLQEMGIDPDKADVGTKEEVRQVLLQEIQQKTCFNETPSPISRSSPASADDTQDLNCCLDELIESLESSFTSSKERAPGGAGLPVVRSSPDPLGSTKTPRPTLSLEPNSANGTTRTPPKAAVESQVGRTTTGIDWGSTPSPAHSNSAAGQDEPSAEHVEQENKQSKKFVRLMIWMSCLAVLALATLITLVYLDQFGKRILNDALSTPAFPDKLDVISNRSSWRIVASKQREGEEASRAIDGNPLTRWGTGGRNEPPQWVILDLGRTQEIHGIEILWYANFTYSYDVQVSLDGENWEGVGQGKERSGTCRHLFAETARYIKINCNHVSGPFVAISELRPLEIKSRRKTSKLPFVNP